MKHRHWSVILIPETLGMQRSKWYIANTRNSTWGVVLEIKEIPQSWNFKIAKETPCPCFLLFEIPSLSTLVFWIEKNFFLILYQLGSVTLGFPKAHWPFWAPSLKEIDVRRGHRLLISSSAIIFSKIHMTS